MNDQPIKRRLFWFWLVLIPLIGILIPSIIRASVDVVYFRGVSGPDFIRLEWQTEAEIDFAGFLLYRGLVDSQPQAVQIGPFIPAQGLPPIGGADYEYVDQTITEGVIYYYWLGKIDQNQNQPYGYEGPVIISTSGGTIINTPVPTTPGQASPTPTHTSLPGSPTFTVTPAATSGNGGTAPATATVSSQATPSVQPPATNIPGGTFPQPPTPTRFVFSGTPAAGIPATPATTSGDPGVDPGGSVDTGSSPPGDSTAINPGEDGALPPPPDALPELPSSADTNPLVTPTSPAQVAVLGEAAAAAPPSLASHLPPPPGSESSQPATPRRWSSPFLMMGLLVAAVFTLGGMVTASLVLIKK